MDVKVDLEREILAYEADQAVHVQLVVRAPELARPEGRKPVNVVVVIDRSGSMAGEKLAQATGAVCQLIDQLARDDLFSLIAFDDDATVVVPAGPARDKVALKEQSRKIGPGGGTNLSGGWFLGVTEAKRNLAPGRISRVLLLTDGQANQGIVEPGRLVAQAHAFRDEGVELSTLGYGNDFNEDLLQPLALAGHGTFHYVKTPDQAPAVFREELQGLLAVVAQNLRAMFHWGSGAQGLTLLNDLPVTRRDDSLELSLGSLLSGDEKILVFRVVVKAGAGPGRVRLGEVRLEYDWVVGEVRHESHTYPVEATHAPGVRAVQERPLLRVVENVVRMESVLARKRAIEEADRGDFAGARNVLETFQERYAPLAGDSAAIKEELARLETERANLTAGARYKEARKESRLRSYQICTSTPLRPPRDKDDPSS